MLERLVLASHNAKKVRELREILQPHGIALASLADFPGAVAPEEDGDTFEDNAVLKARAARAFTGLPALADDSGLIVAGLDGEPGVRSARYAGENADDAANNRHLLERLSGKVGDERRAKFVCVIALDLPGEDVRLFRGETSGRILEHTRGRGGFGYDPLFLSDDLGLSFGEADPGDKNCVSHRARALSELILWLDQYRSG